MILILQGSLKLEKLFPLLSTSFLSLFFLFYIFSVCFLSAAFQSFLIESFRGVILKDGYPQDKNKTEFKAKSTFVNKILDILHWAFSWIFVWTYKGKKKE